MLKNITRKVALPLVLTPLLGTFTLLANESSPAEHWSLAKIIARASERTPEIKALGKDIDRAENLARQAGKWDNPEGGVSYGPMNQAGLTGGALDLTLKQRIPLFGQRAVAERLGEQNKVTVEVESKMQILRLRHEVVRLAYRLAALEEQAKHLSHRREKIGLIAKFTETRPFASPSQAVEKNLVLNRLREIEENFLEITAAQESAWQALNVFLNVDARITPETTWLTKPVIPDHERLWTHCQAQNPELQHLNSLISAANIEADQAVKQGLPDIRIGVTYSEQTADVPQRIYTGTIEFSIPILDRGGYAKLAALAEKDAATYRLDQKLRDLQSQFDQAWAKLVQNKKRIELYPIGLVETLEAQMSRTEQNWKKGLVPVTAFLELENQVHGQAVKVFDAQTAFVEALSQVQVLAGSDFEMGKN